MKKTILLILAMCFAFAMPAQADEGYEGFAPVESLIVSGDVIGPKVTDDKVTTCRCMRSQLEAAEYMANKTTAQTEFVGLAKPINEGATPAAGPFERGWRQLA